MNRKQRRAAAKQAGTPRNLHGKTSAAAIPSTDVLLAAGLQHHQAGRLGEAERIYRQILAVDARHADSLHLLGVIAHQAGHHAVAVELMSQAIKLRADIPDYYNNRGIALEEQRKLDEAIASYRRALALKPDYAEAHCNLGNALRELGKLNDAVVCYQRALKCKPDFAKAYNNLGNTLRELGKPDEAAAACRHALMIDPQLSEAHSNLGNALRELGNLDDAVASYQRALAVRPDYVEAHNNLGITLRDLGRLDEAIASFQRALTLKPDYAEAHHNLSMAFRNLGKLDEARRASEKAVALDPGTPLYCVNLLEIKPVAAGDRHLAAAEELANRESTPRKEQIGLQFALAKAYGDLDDHERAFRHVLEGNALKRQEMNYDEAAQLALFDRIREIFTPELMRSKQGLGNSSEVPIFILGMPRSGSTLVEQILASHPAVFGAGELTALSRLATSLNGSNGEPFPEIVPTLSGENLRQFGCDYLAAISIAAPEAKRITDKMPSNFSFAGLIHLALPNARIIHTRRDPLDTCFSCFFKVFGGDQPFAYDLGELGRYYRAYEALMEHWRHVLPQGVMLEVQYEDIVADLEGQARRLISACGLEWNDACLEFYRTQRPVWTASFAQVRQPIYKSSVGRWRRYEKQLQPLIDALGADLVSI
jgi:tetratricopeptide (TPR) repeat protein